MRPLARSRRASFLPRVSRFSNFSVAAAITQLSASAFSFSSNELRSLRSSRIPPATAARQLKLTAGAAARRTTTRPTSPRGCSESPARAGAPPTAAGSSCSPRARSECSGIVLVMITCSIGAASSRSIAGPDSTPCTAQAITRSAPLALSALAAFTIVPGRVDDVVLDDAGPAGRRRRSRSSLRPCHRRCGACR